ncbi:MAG: hypothetical protein H6Q72_4328 [Firmicutes bacterium]|nr:hypothetical protein [Bacillota bacterium]
MILERIYELALPKLSGKRIREVRVGLNLLMVELDDGSLGVTYVLRDDIGHGCTAIPEAGQLLGKDAKEIAEWALKGKNVLPVAIGLAILNSVAEFDKLEQIDNLQDADAMFAVETKPTDTVGMIGYIGPLITNLKGKVKNLLVFERGECSEGVYPETREPDLLPECQVVYISSTSLINGTLEKLLTYCSRARDVVMVGSSTPMYPEAFQGSGVTVLSGTRWLSANREAIFQGVSQCAGMWQLIKNGQKMSVRVK